MEQQGGADTNGNPLHRGNDRRVALHQGFDKGQPGGGLRIRVRGPGAKIVQVIAGSEHIPVSGDDDRVDCLVIRRFANMPTQQPVHFPGQRVFLRRAVDGEMDHGLGLMHVDHWAILPEHYVVV